MRAKERLGMHIARFYHPSQLHLRTRAFTLIEVIIVVALVAFVYSVAMPNLGMQTSNDVAQSLGQMNADIRNAFDLSVLTHKPHRLAFRLGANEYWLEVCDQENFFLGDSKVRSEPTQEDIAEGKEKFEIDFEKYRDLAGEEYTDPAHDKKVPAESPVLKAKSALMGVTWSPVSSLEWNKRSITSLLIIKDIQAEHHEKPVSVEEYGEEAIAYLYFMPKGYVEKASLHIYYRLGDRDFDASKTPYTILTKPHAGEGRLIDGSINIQFHEDREVDDDDSKDEDT